MIKEDENLFLEGFKMERGVLFMKRQSHLNFHTIGFYYTLFTQTKIKRRNLLHKKALNMDESMTYKRKK